VDIAAFEKVFDKLKHTVRFEPVRFAVIQGLYDRLKTPQHKSNSVLFEKAQNNIEEYRVDFQRCRDAASLIIGEIERCFPEHLNQARVLFEQCEFKQLERLSGKLERNQKAQEEQSRLNDLNDSMGKSRAAGQKSAQPKSLDEILHQQEQAARLAIGCAQLKVNESPDGRFELQSMKGFREAKKYFNIDKIITRAINDYPENAGPHNPHMLAIKSLMHMRDLSPQYLRRFAGYAETILWLEKNSVKLNRKKTS